MMKVLRRSSLSMLRSAMMPPITATTPNAMLASIACSSPMPDSSSTRVP